MEQKKDSDNKKPFCCPRCGNTDPRLIGNRLGVLYCRRCISFLGDELTPPPLQAKTVGFHLSYSLSKEQKALSDTILDNFKNGIDTLVYAVCGSGKTEISYGVIGYAMSKGMHVGFALPRRDVVIELVERIQEAFPQSKVVAVYGGHTSELEGDCIVCTTHQLYRYPNYFDLLVMDEIDAFPFKGSEVLQSFYEKSVCGHTLMMTATPSRKVIDAFKAKNKRILCLHTRFHKKPIPEPVIQPRFSFFKFFCLVRLLAKYEKESKPVMVFVPTIDDSRRIALLLRVRFPQGTYVNSQREDRSKVISRFKQGKYRYLVTTAVLERGVTVANCQVIVYEADHIVYDAATLVQIAGRAGRKSSAPKGDVIFIAETESEGMKRAIEEIKYCNTFLQGVHETI